MKTIIDWFARNHIAANLLMVLILLVGIMSVLTIRQEFIPAFSLDMVTISVPYPGAAPSEVESAICLRIEEAIDGLDGIKRVFSTASAGVAGINIEIHPHYDADNMLSEIKSRIDAISTFPADVERPIISKPSIRSPVIQIVVSGDLDAKNLRALAEVHRERLAALPALSQVEISSAQDHEISIEISELTLQRHQLSFQEVSNAIRNSSFDLPAGSIRSVSGDILLRTKDQAYEGKDYGNIIISSDREFGSLRLRDIAHIRDSFVESDSSISFDGKDAISLLVYRIGDQDILDIAHSVRAYVDQASASLPPGAFMHVWQDESQLYRDRLEMLSGNALSGLILVFLLLVVFLGGKLAFWVSLGIPISFMGAFAAMLLLDKSLNMISLFAFLLVIGIVVDDAIVVGESIHRHQGGDKKKDGEDLVSATVRGAHFVGRPVFLAVLTTIIAFAPMLFLPGVDGKFWNIIPIVVISCLIFSLVESLLILPAHLGQTSRIAAFFCWWFKPLSFMSTPCLNACRRAQTWFLNKVECGICNIYLPILKKAITYKYATMSIFMFFLLICVGFVTGARIKTVFFPSIEADFIIVDLVMPVGTPIQETEAAIQHILQQGKILQKELSQDLDRNVISHFFQMNGGASSRSRENGGSSSASHLGQIIAELDPHSITLIATEDISKRWRTMCGDIMSAESLSFESNFMHGNFAIQTQITSSNLGELGIITERLTAKLAAYQGVYDITHNFPRGKDEIVLKLNDRGRALGLDQMELARQVQSSFFGLEAQRIQRGRDDVRVRIRFPEHTRKNLASLQQMYIRKDADRIPLSEVADLEFGHSYSTIRRQDGHRVIMITAQVDHATQNADTVDEEFMAYFNKEIRKEFPSARIKQAGKQEDRGALVSALGKGMLVALVLIYAVMAISFKSYLQPLIIMSAIPFGLMGAIIGHIVLGMPLSMLSLLGMIALTGVIVNDSLVLIDSVNRHAEAGMPFNQAICTAGHLRFRAIILTTLTTFLGLLPMMMETSMQAQFLIPMVVALAFGVMFATFVTLLFVPALTSVIYDARNGIEKVSG